MASVENYLASVDLWPMNWAPQGWANCTGTLLAISQYSALFALIGTTFGGNGVQTFGLPNMQGSVPIGIGVSPTGTVYNIGQVGGQEHVTLSISQMPSHTHVAAGTVNPKAGTGKLTLSGDPTNNFPAQSTTTVYSSANNVTMGQSPVAVTVQPVGNSLPVNILPPYVALNYIIALTGIFPTRG